MVHQGQQPREIILRLNAKDEIRVFHPLEYELFRSLCHTRKAQTGRGTGRAVPLPSTSVRAQPQLVAGTGARLGKGLGITLTGALPHSTNRAKEWQLNCLHTLTMWTRVTADETKPKHSSMSDTGRKTIPHEDTALGPVPVAWLGLWPGEAAFQQVVKLPNIRGTWTDGDALCFAPAHKNIFITKCLESRYLLLLAWGCWQQCR